MYYEYIHANIQVQVLKTTKYTYLKPISLHDYVKFEIIETKRT